MIGRTLASGLACAVFICVSISDSNADLTSAIAECNSADVSDEDFYDHLILDECPDIIAEVESSLWHEVLEPGWREDMTDQEFSQLEYFASYYSQHASTDSEILLASLDEVVMGLGVDEQQADSESFWDRIINWFEELLSEETDDSPGWLFEKLANIRLSTSVIEILFWTMSALIVAAAVVIIVREVRAVRRSMPAGVTRRNDFGHGGSFQLDDRLLTLKDVDLAALNDKPSILLRLLLQQLEAMGALVHRPSRTHREVGNASGELNEGRVDIISRVAASAERIRYGGEENRTQEIGEVVSVGTSLYSDLKPEQT